MKTTRGFFYTLVSILTVFTVTSCWQNKSPEDLPRLKKAFQSQVASFEKKKEQANDNVIDSMESLGALKDALEGAKNEDKEFAKVYGDWEKVDKRVRSLNKEYEDLKTKAEKLFTAMEEQSNGLADPKNKADLLRAIKSARTKYNGTLVNASKAIEKLRVLHGDAVDVVKALEVAVALNSFDNINTQLESIESRVGDIMSELNVAVVESKKLYEKRLDELE
jgi:DNA repair ATPase RecN